MKCLSVLIFLFCLRLEVKAQNQLFYSYSPLCDTCNHRLSLRIEAVPFVKNNEYFGPTTIGWTGIGFLIKPRLEYYVSPSTKLSAGYFLLKYSGLDKFSQTIPLFSVQQKLGKHVEVVLGNIYGSLDHRLEEPLFRFDRYYQNNVEYGVQLLAHNSRIWSDTWINWEKFIEKSSLYQEEFVGGNSTDIELLRKNKFKIHLPIQMLVAHAGGQIDSARHHTLSTWNWATGLSFRYQLSVINSLCFDLLYFFYNGFDLPPAGAFNSQHYSIGHGIYPKLYFISDHLNLMVGYWTEKKFIALRGEYLFEAISEYDPNFKKDMNSLVTCKIALKKNFTDYVKTELRGDFYYDPDRHFIDYSYGIYLVANVNLFLTKIHPDPIQKF